jgi:hypothetical protein
VISKTSGAFDPADVAKVVEAIQLKNTDADSQFGIRTATITYTDGFTRYFGKISI